MEYILNSEQVEEQKLFEMIKNIFNKDSDFALLSEMISLPSEQIIHQHVERINVKQVHLQREISILSISNALKELFYDTFQKLF